MPESHFLLKKRLWHRYFPVNFGKFLRRYFLTEHLRWLLLYVAFFYLEVFILLRKGVLRNFQKFTGEHLCHSAFFNKVAGMSPAALFRKRLWHRCFWADMKFLRTPFSQNTSWRLLFSIVTYLNEMCNQEQKIQKT